MTDLYRITNQQNSNEKYILVPIEDAIPDTTQEQTTSLNRHFEQVDTHSEFHPIEIHFHAVRPVIDCRSRTVAAAIACLCISVGIFYAAKWIYKL